MEKHFSLGIYNYNREKICDLYDSQVELIGQAYNIIYSEERSGYHSLEFEIPRMVNDEKNFRWDYLKSDYLIRYACDNYEVWFVASKPSKAKAGKSIVGHVSCSGIESLLKTGNIYATFDDENGIGTIGYLMEQILKGTPWQYASWLSDTLYESDGQTEKVRSLISNDKKGALDLITTACSLFCARPVFDTSSMIVYVLDMKNHNQVLEGEVGRNLNALTVNHDSSNMCTRVYIEGEYGDYGYVGIDDVKVDENGDIDDEGEPWGLPFLLDFDYYRELGVFTLEHENALETYLTDIRGIKSEIREKGVQLTECEDELNALVGQCKFALFYKSKGYDQPAFTYGFPENTTTTLEEGDMVVVLKNNHTHIYEEWPSDPATLMQNAYGVAKFITKAAGKIGAAEVQIEAKQKTIAQLEYKISSTTRQEKIDEYNAEIDKLNNEINVLYNGNGDDIEGLYSMMYRVMNSAGLLFDLDTILDALSGLNASQEQIESDFANAMGPMLRDGCWSNQNYIPGQEKCLYADAKLMTKEMCKPKTDYTFDYVRVTEDFDIPIEDIVINGEFHIYDEELQVDDVLYIKRTSYGVDNKSLGTIEVGTQDVILTGGSFSDLLGKITNLANIVDQKNAVYDRAKAINKEGLIDTSALIGDFDVSNFNFHSSVGDWSIDPSGNFVFNSGGGGGSVRIGSGGVSVATDKDADGNWDYHPTVTPDGIDADDVNRGFLDYERLDPSTGSKINISDNTTIGAINTSICTISSAICVVDSYIAIISSGVEIINSNIETVNSNINIVNSNINTVNSNINTVNSNINTVNSNINTVNSNINTVNSNINTVNSNINTVNSNINTINSNINTVNSNINTVNSNINTINSSINTINSSINTVNSVVNTINSTVNTVNSLINTVDSLVNTVNSTVNTVNSLVNTVNSSINTINSNISTINSNIITINSNISTINSNICTINTNISTINASITAINTNIYTINTNISTVNFALSAINTTISTQDFKFDGINSNITTINTDICTLNVAVNAINTNISTQDFKFEGINASITAINTDICTLNVAVSAINTAISTQDFRFEGINSNITAINTDISTLNLAVNAVNTTISTQDFKFDGINTNITAINTDICALNVAVNAINTDISTQNFKFNAINANITTINTSIEAVNTDINTLNVAVSAINTTISTQDFKFEGVNSNITAISTDICALNVAVNSINTSIETQDFKFEGINTNITAINTDISTLNLAVNSINTTISTQDFKFEGVNSSITAINTNIETVNTNISTLNLAVNAINTDISTQNFKFEGINSSITAINADISAINSQVTTINSIVYADNASICVINTHISAIDETLIAHKAQIDEINANYITVADLEGESVRTGDLYCWDLNALNIHADDDIDCSTLTANEVHVANIQIGSNSFDNVIVSASVSNDGKTLTLTPLIGNPINFSKATSGTVTGNWGSGTFTVTGGENELATHLTNTGHWGDTAEGEDPWVYYYKTYATMNSSLTSDYTGNHTEINASSIYSRGQTDAGLLINSEDGQIERVANSSVKAVSVTVTNPTFVYDSATHKYTATASARASNTVMDTGSSTTGTEAYGDGWGAAYSKVSIVSDGTAGSTLTFKYPASTVGVSASYTYNVSVDDSYAYIMGGDNVRARIANTAYSNGRSKGLSDAGITIDQENNQVACIGSSTTKAVSITVTKPTLAYNSTTHKYTATASAKASNIVMDTSTSDASGLEAYNAGWGAAYSKISLPADGTGATIAFVYPSTTVGGSASATYTLSVDDSYAYVKTGTNTKARVANSAYSNGRTQGRTDAGVEIDTANGQVSRALNSSIKSVSITVTKPTLAYDSTTHKYTATASARASSTVMDTSTSDASGLEAYNAGWGDARGKVQIVVAGTGGSTVTFKYPGVNVGAQASAVYNVEVDESYASIMGEGGVKARVANTPYATAYESGRTQGRTDAGVVIDTENGQVSRALNSSTKAVSITVTKPTLAYNSTTHKYTATASAKAASTVMDTDTSAASGLEAYNDGWGAAYSKVSLTYDGTGGSTITFKYPSSSIGGQAYYTYNLSVDDSYAYIMGMDGSSVRARIANSAYSNGRTQGRTDAGVVIDAENGQVSRALNSTTKAVSITVTKPTLAYNSTTHKYTATASAKASGTVMDTDTSAASGLEAYNDGWGAAYGQVSLSAAGTGGSTVTFKYPASTVGVQASYTYNLAVDDSYAYIMGGSNVRARIANTAYSNGRTQGRTDAGVVIDADNGQVSRALNSATKAVSITVTKPTLAYNSTTHKYTATASAKASSTVMDTATSDASGLEAYNAGWGAAYGVVGLPANSTGATITFSYPSSTVGSSTSASYTLSVDDSYAYVKTGSNTKARVSNTAYANGRTQGRTDAGVVIDTANGQVSRALNSTTKAVSITVTKPTLTYNATTHKYTATASAKASSTVMDTATSNASGLEAYNAGWGSARGEVSLPANSTGATITFAYPSTTVGSGTSTSYSLSVDDSYAYVTLGTSTKARVSNGAYSNGRTQGRTDAGVVIDTANGQVSRALNSTTKSVSITVTSPSYSYNDAIHGYSITASAKASSSVLDDITITTDDTAWQYGYADGYYTGMKDYYESARWNGTVRNVGSGGSPKWVISIPGERNVTTEDYEIDLSGVATFAGYYTAYYYAGDGDYYYLAGNTPHYWYYI